MSKFSIGQLRGAYAAGRRDAEAATGVPVENPEQVERCIASTVDRLAAMVARDGSMAFSRTTDSHETARAVIANLFSIGGEAATDEAFDRFELAMDKAGADPASIGYMSHCLEARFEEVVLARKSL